ncbi:putative repeat protein (TIGR03806 family) [Blastomonas natatoria]|uniref:Putative repeat protein (TIGR03806 family) n=1 Tax=Blastomonas natatoria TaxID=34015 RepID=A0A2V3V2S7_9SPHN|nr:SO2930 family diheme c-type cytochrome [Blastomonas natatoria]PXW75860.1 putative repeat protein (TIGR03806 family) [Blastomonas natatoria]
MKRWGVLGAVAAAALLAGALPDPASVNDSAIIEPAFPRKLSEFRFFAGPGATRPTPALVAYSLRTPLFSDYAEKQRFVYVPDGERISADGRGRLAFPVGSALIKTFGYGNGKAFRPIETRVLLRRANGWEALPYVWNADLSDADLKVAGTRLPVTLTLSDGTSTQISYAVPNKNQCKECHSSSGNIVPIGPIAANMEIAPTSAAAFRARIDWAGSPIRADGPVWNDPATGSLDQRARAYLMVNCAHCHNPTGSASNSGLFLDADAGSSRTALGIYKRPVAAGRGSGGHEFAIEPGQPARSIMIHRMASTEPGVAMPEVGRSLVHEEGVALIRQWISSLPAD